MTIKRIKMPIIKYESRQFRERALKIKSQANRKKKGKRGTKTQ